MKVTVQNKKGLNKDLKIFVEKKIIDKFIDDISKSYLTTFHKNLTPIKVNIANGLTFKKIK